MPRKTSPQKRYANAVHAIMRRSGEPWKVARLVYKERREAIGKPLTATRFRAYSKDYFRTLVKEAKGEATLNLFSGEEFAFDILQGATNDDVSAILETIPKTLKELTLSVNVFKDGVFLKTVTVTRKLVHQEDFWSTYRSMIRDTVEKEGSLNAFTVTTISYV